MRTAERQGGTDVYVCVCQNIPRQRKALAKNKEMYVLSRERERERERKKEKESKSLKQWLWLNKKRVCVEERTRVGVPDRERMWVRKTAPSVQMPSLCQQKFTPLFVYIYTIYIYSCEKEEARAHQLSPLKNFFRCHTSTLTRFWCKSMSCLT